MKRIAAGARLITLAAVFGALALSSPAAASLPRGRVIYSAHFSSPAPGWYQTKWSVFEDRAYVIHTPSIGLNLIGNDPHFVPPRGDHTSRELECERVRTVGLWYPPSRHQKSGFQISYLVHRNEEWTFYEGEGSAPQKLLAWGSDPHLDVTHQTSVTAICDALPHTIKLGLYLNGRRVSSHTVSRPKIMNPGYIGINIVQGPKEVGD